MFSQTNKRRDPFTFSLGGMTAFGGFTGIPAVADDRFSKTCDNEKSVNTRQNLTRWSLRSGRKAA